MWHREGEESAMAFGTSNPASESNLFARGPLLKTSTPLLVMIVVALVLIVITGLDLRTKINAFSEVTYDNRTWVLAQLEVDSQALRLALQQAQLEQVPTSETDSSVRKKFDIYYSRLLSVGAAVQSLSLDPETNASFARIISSRDEMAALIDRRVLFEPRDIQILAEISLRDASDIRSFVIRVAQVFGLNGEAKRVEHRTLLLRLGWLMAMLFVLMAAAIVLTRRISRVIEAQARASERTALGMRRIVNASLDAVLVVDLSGTIIHRNAAALVMFGRDGSEIRGSSVSDYLFLRTPDSVDKSVFAELLHDLGHGVKSGIERHRLTGLHQSGQEFPVELSMFANTDDEGVFRSIVFLRDITSENNSEMKLRNARDLARSELAEKSRFLAVMSHEMRTPLHGVLASLDLMDTETLSDANRQFLKTAQGCGVSALSQVDEVLEVSRSGAAEVTLTYFEPRELVASLISDLVPIATDRGNRLLLTPEEPGTCPAVLGWQRGFLLVIRNLISNALKFTHDGEIVVTLGCTPYPDGFVALVVSVRDTGIGIDPKDHDRIFQEFQTIDDDKSVGIPGVGLGLAIARSAVERMNSVINLQSTPGLGSCFSFRLLLKAASVDRSVITADLPIGEEFGTVTPFVPRRVLVVDDNAVNLALLAEMLRRIGHRPETAQDGQTAVAMAQKEAFDLILMDIWMPGMDGLATTHAIRASGASAYCPIVGLTALLMEERRTNILDAGMQDVLSKPLRLAELRSYLADFFADHLQDEDYVQDESFEEACSVMGDGMMIQLVEAVILDAEAALTALRTPDFTEVTRQALHRAAGSAAVVGALMLADALRKGERNFQAGNAGSADLTIAQITAELAKTRNYVQRRWPDRSWGEKISDLPLPNRTVLEATT